MEYNIEIGPMATRWGDRRRMKCRQGECDMGLLIRNLIRRGI